jgi:hypothetical protein
VRFIPLKGLFRHRYRFLVVELNLYSSIIPLRLLSMKVIKSLKA